jgi:nicotinamidase/pyrazinamidase
VAFWDVDTQNDFMLPGGKLYVRGAEKLRPSLRKLYALARKARIPVVATGDAHSETDEELREWPPHCLKGTEGQKKLPETLLPKRGVVPHDAPVAHRSVATPQGEECQAVYGGPPLLPGTQVLLEKCHLDAFTNPSASALVRSSGIDRWVVFGVATDYAVRVAVLGLLKLGKKVTVVSDAVRGVRADTARQAVIEMQAAGAEFKSTAAVLKALGGPARPRTRAPLKKSRRPR